ncbi:hypothetical protein AB8O64_02885 [Streptomyces sp. QH1-20]|uniref:hypothetical protein n=1 Tax=Streptomyces sp. QH1-20 TaxID=3240934 RepID=UPI0035114838
MRDQPDFERSDADILAGLQLSYAVSYGKPIKGVSKDDDSGAGSVALSRNGGKPLLEARTDAKKVYARADFKELGEPARLGTRAATAWQGRPLWRAWPGRPTSSRPPWATSRAA